jgi:hypothetical protein
LKNVVTGPSTALDEATQLFIRNDSAVSPTELLAVLQVTVESGFATLIIQPTPYRSGSGTIYFTLQDNGGIARGGRDQNASSIDVLVTYINDPAQL